MKDKFRVLAGFIILLTMFAPAVEAEGLPSFNEVYGKAKEINPKMKDCQAKLNLQFNVQMYVPLRFQMSGDYLYKAPNKYKINLKRTPSYLKKHPQVFSWALPDTKDFNCKVSGKEKTKDITCYLIELDPKQPMGDLLKHKIWINAENYTIPKQAFYYDYGGEIEVIQNYKLEKEFWVFDNLVSTFSFPKINLKATVLGLYTNYLFNQNLPDSLFK